MKINNLYQYVPLERVTHNDGTRYYVSPEGHHLSSVTTILSATSDMTGLNEWRDWIGHKKANQIRDEATGLGTLLHTHLENFIQGIPRPGGTNLVRKMATNMGDQIINRGLINIDEIWGLEAPLYYPGLYAGTADLIGVHKGEPAIMDYKTTNKIKTKEMISNYFMQCAAYAMSHNKLYETSIRKAVIFMVARDLQYEEFIIEGEEFDYWENEWIQRISEFYAKE